MTINYRHLYRGTLCTFSSDLPQRNLSSTVGGCPSDMVTFPPLPSYGQVCFFDNLCYHLGLIHVIIKLIVVRDVDTHEFLVRTVRYNILMFAEVLYEGIPLVCDIFRSEPTKVVAVGGDEDRLTIYPPVEQLESPWCICQIRQRSSSRLVKIRRGYPLLGCSILLRPPCLLVS